MIDKILEDREMTHGDYYSKAIAIQDFKICLRSSESWWQLEPDMQESLDMIVSKIGRILYGNPNHIDHWADIAGYSQLIIDRLQESSEKPQK